MKNKKRTRAYPVDKVLQRALTLTVPVLILFFAVSFFSYIELRAQNDLAVRNAVDIYENELHNKLSAIEHFVQWTVVHDPILDDFSLDKHMGDYSSAAKELRLRVSDMQYSTGYEYQYFFYWDEGDLYFNASGINSSYETYKVIREKVKYDAEGNLIDPQNFLWVPCDFGDDSYLYYCITYKHRTFVSLVKIEDLLSPLSSINLGSRGMIELKDGDGKTIYQSGEGPLGFRKLFYSEIMFDQNETGLPFSIVITTDKLGNYGKLFFLQFLIFLTALILALIMGGYILFTYKKVISPIRIFSNNLSKLETIEDSSEALLDLTDSRVQELNQINEQFKNLIHEITRLRINIYESELEQNKFSIRFLQQQIKPHFYLNCLTTIDSMVSVGDSDAAKKMLQFTSRYFRYLFQVDKDFVTVENELSHIKDYLDIQNMRLSDPVEYDCDIESDLLQVKMPPLILITFAENAIKHAVPESGFLRISICGHKRTLTDDSDIKKFKNDTCFEIRISDNGQGFSEEILEKIRMGKSLSVDGEHIGLTNCIKRLGLMYEDAYDLTITNSDEGGALIVLMIPLEF